MLKGGKMIHKKERGIQTVLFIIAMCVIVGMGVDTMYSRLIDNEFIVKVFVYVGVGSVGVVMFYYEILRLEKKYNLKLIK